MTAAQSESQIHGRKQSLKEVGTLNIYLHICSHLGQVALKKKKKKVQHLSPS